MLEGTDAGPVAPPAAAPLAPSTSAASPPSPAPAGAADGNPLARPPASPFAGAFSGDGLTLALDGPPAALVGEIVHDGARYPATAVDAGGRLAGRFVANGASFDFTATGDAAGVVLETEGARFTLAPTR